MNRIFLFLSVIMLSCFITSASYGQNNKTLKGIVLNDARKPVGQVTINIPGSKPVYTDDKGTFTIPRVAEKEWLFITPIEKYSAKNSF